MKKEPIIGTMNIINYNMKKISLYIAAILLLLSSIATGQSDTSFVSYLQITTDSTKTLIPVNPQCVHDTLYYYEAGLEYDTLYKVLFTWADCFGFVHLGKGYLIEESTLWTKELSAYAQPEKQLSQYFIISNRGKRFLLNNIVVDQDEYSKVVLNSKRNRGWGKRHVLQMFQDE